MNWRMCSTDFPGLKLGNYEKVGGFGKAGQVQLILVTENENETEEK